MIRLVGAISDYWLALSLLMLAGITFLSFLPLSEAPVAPGSDKLHHLIAYSLLVVPLAIRQPAYWVLMVVGCVVWSGVIEFLQPMVGRFGEWQDLGANALGLVIGVLIGTAIRSVCR